MWMRDQRSQNPSGGDEHPFPNGFLNAMRNKGSLLSIERPLRRWRSGGCRNRQILPLMWVIHKFDLGRICLPQSLDFPTTSMVFSCLRELLPFLATLRNSFGRS